MTSQSKKRFLDAVNSDIGLRDKFVYYMDFADYENFPDPFPRTRFAVKEAQATIERYPNPERPGENFRWDIHGRLLTPDNATLRNTAVVMIHGGAANECEFLFTPDGPEQFVDLTKIPPGTARVGIAQHIASLGLPVLAISLPGHYSAKPWPPVAIRKPEFILGETPADAELTNRLAVYTFRMCLEAIKTLIEKHLPGFDLFVWGHSTGCEYLYLLEQYGLKNRLAGGLGFGTGMTAWMRRDWAFAANEQALRDRASKLLPITGMNRRSAHGYAEAGYVGTNQPWGSAERWFELEDHRRPQFKPFLHDIEHHGIDFLRDEVRKQSGLPDAELFVTLNGDLNRLRGKKMLYIVGEGDQSHWVNNGEKGLDYRLQYYAAKRFATYADKIRLIVIPRLTHYGHIEAHNERLANVMVTSLNEYFR